MNLRVLESISLKSTIRSSLRTSNSYLSWLKVRFQHWLVTLTSLETACRVIHQSRPEIGPVWYPLACECLSHQLLSMDGRPKKEVNFWLRNNDSSFLTPFLSVYVRQKREYLMSEIVKWYIFFSNIVENLHKIDSFTKGKLLHNIPTFIICTLYLLISKLLSRIFHVNYSVIQAILT